MPPDPLDVIPWYEATQQARSDRWANRLAAVLLVAVAAIVVYLVTRP